MATKGPIEFKGNLSGLYLNVDEEASFDDVYHFLTTLLESKGSFYKGSKIIGLIGQSFSYREKAKIEALLVENYDISVYSLEDQLDTVYKPEKTVVVASEAVQETIPDTHYVYGTMRSGKSVEYAGNVVVIGDVNPGAEIIAKGNVFVFGRLLGFVHAGCMGDEHAMIVANVLKPTQIRIAKHISVPPHDDHSVHSITPEIAHVHEGIIKIDKYH